MAFLAVAMFDSVAAVNPLLVVPSILMLPLEYLLTLVVFAGVLAVRWARDTLLPTTTLIALLSVIVSNCLGLYLVTVEMRILGVLYFCRKDKLNWFKR